MVAKNESAALCARLRAVSSGERRAAERDRMSGRAGQAQQQQLRLGRLLRVSAAARVRAETRRWCRVAAAEFLQGRARGVSKCGDLILVKSVLRRAGPECEDVRDGCGSGEVVSHAGGQTVAQRVCAVEAIGGQDERVALAHHEPAERWTREKLQPGVRGLCAGDAHYVNARGACLLPAHCHPHLGVAQLVALRVRMVHVQCGTIANRQHEPDGMSGGCDFTGATAGGASAVVVLVAVVGVLINPELFGSVLVRLPPPRITPAWNGFGSRECDWLPECLHPSRDPA